MRRGPGANGREERQRGRARQGRLERKRGSEGFILRLLKGQTYVCVCVGWGCVRLCTPVCAYVRVSPEQHVTGVTGGDPFKRVHVEVVKVAGGILRKDV